MSDYREQIARCEQEVNALDRKVHETVKMRDSSREAREIWIRAAHDFRTYYSPIDDLLEACLKSDLPQDINLRQFVFDYIDQDPYFFRSGYILEKLLQRVKKLSLTPAEKTSLQRLLLKRIDTRALRNFRNICRLTHMIDSNGFHAKVSSRARSADPQINSRARFALEYFPFDGRRQGDGFIMK